MGYIGVIWDSIGIMEKKMETTILKKVYIGAVLGLYRYNGKENGNYCNRECLGFEVWGVGRVAFRV